MQPYRGHKIYILWMGSTCQIEIKYILVKKFSMAKQKSNLFALSAVGLLFFIFGFITWLNGTLIPFLKITCQLNNFQAYLVTFAFYISYFVMALPSGWVLYKIGFKKGIVYGLALMGVGTLIFIPAALTRLYIFFLVGLFIQGIGLALLQTAVNPYVTELGPIESAASRISLMGLCNKLAGIISPLILGGIILKNVSSIVNQINTAVGSEQGILLDQLSHRIILPYVIMAVALFSLALLFRFWGLNDIDDEKTSLKNGWKIFKYPQVVLGFIAIFFYVGVEVIAADTIALYGQSQGILIEKARLFPSLTLLFMMLGYVIGIITIPKYITQDKALVIATFFGLLFSGFAIFTNGFTSVFFISLLGLANAIMWPAIWPLTLDGLGDYTKLGSSILIMGILGGAVIPLLYGYMADFMGNKLAYIILIPCYLYIMFFAAKGHKMKAFATM
jgi:glucose/galactose transporter